jgi:uncharacterized protein
VIFVGDASMAPEELCSPYGLIYFNANYDGEPSINWLEKIRKKFKYSIWLNPITTDKWDDAFGVWTINKIRQIFHMEDLTLNGIKNAVEFLNSR